MARLLSCQLLLDPQVQQVMYRLNMAERLQAQQNQHMMLRDAEGTAHAAAERAEVRAQAASRVAGACGAWTCTVLCLPA